jgi:hypothetical protein
MMIGLISLTVETLHLAAYLTDLWRTRRTG